MRVDADRVLPPGAVVAGVVVITAVVALTVGATLFAVWLLQPFPKVDGAAWGAPACAGVHACPVAWMTGAGLPARVLSAPADGGMA